MSDLSQGMASSERFSSRIIPMLRGDCEGCFVRSKLGLMAEMDNGVQFDGQDAIRRLGSFVGGAIELLDLPVCNGGDCLSDDDKLKLALALRRGTLSPNGDCGEEAVRIAASMNIEHLPGRSDQ